MLEAAAFSTAELAEYCRRSGLGPEQITAWRTAQAREQRHQAKEDKQRIRQLEKELQRK